MTSALDGARRKGIECARAGGSESDCPYEDRRTNKGAITWSRSFRREWLSGFRDERRAALNTGSAE